MADFPNILDQHSRTYMMNRSNMEVELESLRKMIRHITSNLNNYESSHLRILRNQGNRPFFELKMK